MIARIFRARVPQSLQAEFEKKFLSVSVPYVEAAAGLVSVSVARPTRWIPDEYAMEASAKFVLEASPALIRDHNQALIDYLFERLPEGYRLASPRQASQRGVFGCIEVGSRGDTEFLYQTLRDERFVVALREGKIRVAPHLLNSTQDIDRLVVVMAKSWKEAKHVAH